ncbi:transposase (plasmid) [Jannaschia sp. W003]|nr:transposase [Jannaschia sp. W003]
MFSDLRLARGAIRAWREDHNTCRQHSASGNLPLAEFATQIRLDEKDA